MREVCPECRSERFKKNGHIHTGKQNHQCKKCGRQFVLHAENRTIGADQRALVDRLLCEKISLQGIGRAVGVSLRWLMDFLVARFAALPDHLHGLPVVAPGEVIIGRLEVEADEMWSFVAKKAHKQWVWIAMDKQTRQIMAFHVVTRVQNSCGPSFLQCTASRPCSIRIKIPSTPGSFQRHNTKPSRSKRGKPIPSSVSTTRCGSASLVLYATP